jgi:P4 family phage/plasmid primase-like protien
MVEIRMLKDSEVAKKGKTYTASNKDAKEYVKRGLAEYIPEPKKEVKKKTPKKKEVKEEKQETPEVAFENIPTLTYKTKWGTKVHIPNATGYILNNFNFNFKTVWGKAGETVYVWDGKKYTSGGKEVIKTKLEELTSIHCKSTDATEVYEKIKRKTSVGKEEFEVSDRYINFLNGVYDIQSKKLLPHSPNLFFKHLIPLTYDSSKDCPEFKKFMEEALYPEDIPVMQEWYGFCLIRNYFLKKGAICVGQKDTGKTLNQKVLIRFIGEENKCGLSLQKISSNSNFAKYSLRDKHLNAFDDLSSEDLSDGGGFKLATGGGYISAEEKFGDTCEFKSFAKQFFCCNKIPPVKDNNDPAYFDRWIIFKFDNVPDKLDPYLYDKLITSDELSGILNWALEGLFRLIENGKFSYTKSPEQIKNIMERSGNPLAPFVQDVLQKSESGEISKEDLYEVYCEYMKDKDLPKLSKEQLGRRLPSVAHFVQSKRDSKERFWANIKLTEKYALWLENKQKSTNNPVKTTDYDTIDTLFENNRGMGKEYKNDENNSKNSSIYQNIDISSKSPSKLSQDEIKEALEEME